MNTWYQMWGKTYQCQISNAGGWFIGVRFSEFHDFSMTFDDFSKFHNFPLLLQKILFFQIFQFSRPCGNPDLVHFIRFDCDVTDNVICWICLYFRSVFITFNPLCATSFRGNINIYLHFCVTAPHWHGTGSWNPSSCKTRIYLFYIVNIIAADCLAMQGARASATMIFTMLNPSQRASNIANVSIWWCHHV